LLPDAMQQPTWQRRGVRGGPVDCQTEHIVAVPLPKQVGKGPRNEPIRQGKYKMLCKQSRF